MTIWSWSWLKRCRGNTEIMVLSSEVLIYDQRTKEMKPNRRTDILNEALLHYATRMLSNQGIKASLWLILVNLVQERVIKYLLEWAKGKSKAQQIWLPNFKTKKVSCSTIHVRTLFIAHPYVHGLLCMNYRASDQLWSQWILCVYFLCPLGTSLQTQRQNLFFSHIACRVTGENTVNQICTPD